MSGPQGSPRQGPSGAAQEARSPQGGPGSTSTASGSQGGPESVRERAWIETPRGDRQGLAVPQVLRAALVAEARALVESTWPAAALGGSALGMSGACMFWSGVLQVLLHREGVRTMIQAGSCSWPMVRPEQDDGVSATHYGYTWEPDSLTTRLMRAQGRLPELHVWLVRTDLPSPVVIDPTTGTWRERAEREGLAWPAASPPDFLWARAESLNAMVETDYPMGIVYQAERSACELVSEALAREVYPEVASALGLGVKGKRRTQ